MTPEVEELLTVWRAGVWTYRELSETIEIRLSTLARLLSHPEQKPQQRTLTRIQRFLSAQKKTQKRRK